MIYKQTWDVCIYFGGVETPKNLKILIGKFFYYCLKFCQMMPQKSSF